MTAPDLDLLDALLCRADDAFLRARLAAELHDPPGVARNLADLAGVVGQLAVLLPPPPGNSLAAQPPAG
ncbi:MAG: hypothetical protein IT429_26040 [Gemmataceae bacterium]|nr:hypothetical protein [Gemmataceae bacterium]